jgi:DNA adenine methylase
MGLCRRGAKVLMSNSDTELIRRLYRGFSIHQIQVQRSVNSDTEKRGSVPELLIRNYA